MEIKQSLENLLKDISPSSFSSKLKKNQELYLFVLNKQKELNLSTLNEAIYLLLNSLDNPPKCLSCENNSIFISFSKGYRKFCSTNCSKSSKESVLKRKNTLLNKYGVDNIMFLDEFKEKRKTTNLIKYGSEHPMKNKDIHNKTKYTVLNKYGVNNVSKIDFVRKKIEESMINNFGEKTNLISNKEEYQKILKEKYGETYQKNEIILNNRKKNNVKKYGVEHFSQSKEYKFKRYDSLLEKLDLYLKFFNLKRNFLNNDYFGSYIINNNIKEVIKYSFTCLSCNTTFLSGLSDGIYPNKCPHCEKQNGTSSYEIDLESFLNKNGIKYFKNYRRLIEPFEVDFYFPDLKLALEINGLYYHSYEHFNKESINNIDIYLKYNLSPDKGKNFHLLKSKLCEEKEVFLFHINENEYILKNELIKSMILNKLHLNIKKENARNLDIKIVNNKEKNEFLNNNHIQGECNSNIDYGLYKGEELLSLMTFSKVRFENDKENINVYELIRFCNKQGYSIRGGASKLLSHFMKQININDEIVSFADKRYSNGNLYKVLGFKEEYIIPPQQKYFKGMNVYNRMFFQKKNIKQMYEDYSLNKINKIHFGLIKKYNDKLTAQENMYLNGFSSIYDCGLIKFRLIKNF